MLIVVYEHIWLCDSKTGCWSVGDNRNIEALRHQNTVTSINTTQTAARIAQPVLWLGYTLDETRIMTTFLEGVETPKCPGLLLRPNQPPLQWVLGALPLGSKAARCQANQLPSFSAKVTNAWRGTSTSSVPSWIAEWQLYICLRTKWGGKTDLSSYTCICYKKFLIWFCACNKTQSSNFTDKNLILRCRYTNTFTAGVQQTLENLTKPDSYIQIEALNTQDDISYKQMPETWGVNQKANHWTLIHFSNK